MNINEGVFKDDGYEYVWRECSRMMDYKNEQKSVLGWWIINIYEWRSVLGC